MQRDALFDLLARSPRVVTVVTANRRLARSLTAEFDAYQTRCARTVWETPSILPFGAFVAKLYELARHDPALTGVRLPLTAAQERALWQAVIADSDVGVLPSPAAALASDAWSLAHQWDIAPHVRRYRFGADTRAFVDWCDEYQRRLDARGAIDVARLPDVVSEYISSGQLAVPETVVLAGFDDVTPQQQRLRDALKARGVVCEPYEPIRHDSQVHRAECLDARDEHTRMADWVTAQLAANPSARIGIVVPDLAARRRALAAALDAALLPDKLLAPNDVRPYTMSLGGALADVPIVAFFLRALRVVSSHVDFEQASALVRSPYLAGDLHERDTRDRVDAEARRRCERTVSFDQLFDAVRQSTLDCGVEAPRLLKALQAMRDWQRSVIKRSVRPSAWAEKVAELLHSIAAHAAGDRTLDSNEYQALLRWQQLLGEFAELDRVVGRIDPEAAISQLEGLARVVIFQTEASAPPVQVLGVLEANALSFDHLWILGMTADAWPRPMRPHPLLPVELQRSVDMPGANATSDLQRARRQLQQLLQSAPEVIVSHATVESDRKVAPSPLIASLAAWTAAPRAQRFVDALPPVPLESFTDDVAPRWQPVAALHGGTSIVRDQAACPFRAFATHRLDAKAIEPPHDGFDYRERGQLVHDVLARFWTALLEPTRDALQALSDAQRRDLLTTAAVAAHQRMQRRRSAMSPSLLQLESARLVRVVDRWLQFELETRAAFRVAAIEESRTMTVGPLTFTARLDRVDELPDGARVVIDYKTGGAKGPAWLDERPDEPQLPLYLTATEPEARAIALARVRANGMGYSAFASAPEVFPSRMSYWRKSFDSWESLVEFWSTVLDRLASQFAAGEAAVDPKQIWQTCRYCELPTLCRINERGGVVIPELPDEDEVQWMLDEQ